MLIQIKLDQYSSSQALLIKKVPTFTQAKEANVHWDTYQGENNGVG